LTPPASIFGAERFLGIKNDFLNNKLFNKIILFMLKLTYCQPHPVILCDAASPDRQPPWSLPTLSTVNARGKPAIWNTWFDGTQLHCTYGQYDGTLTSVSSKVVPKGKTENEQGYQECKRRWIDKIKGGYKANVTDVTPNDVNSASSSENVQPVPSKVGVEMSLPPAQSYGGYLPGDVIQSNNPTPSEIITSLAFKLSVASSNIEIMKADKYDPKMKLVYPVFVQPKLDGIRGYIKVNPEDGSVDIISRGTNPLSYLHKIKQQLAIFVKYLPPGFILDGEIFTFKIPHEQISGICRRTVNHSVADEEPLEFHMFDVVDPDKMMPFEERNTVLANSFNKAMLERGSELTNIMFVQTDRCDSDEQLLSLHSQYLLEGYEGIMIKKISCSYPLEECRYKSTKSHNRNTLKWKFFHDEEMLVVGVEDSRGTEEGAAKLIVRDKYKNEFAIRCRGSFEMRRKWLQNPETIVGKWYTVRYQNLHEETNIPRFPVGIAERDKV
jgi:hypothetical protein